MMKRELENEPSEPHSGAPTQWLSSLKGVKGSSTGGPLLGPDTTKQTQLPDSTQALPWVGSTHLTVMPFILRILAQTRLCPRPRADCCGEEVDRK